MINSFAMRRRGILRSALFTAVTCVALLGWAGCDSVGPSNTDDQPPENEETTTGTSSMNINLTDAPGDVVRAIVTIKRVAAVPVEDSGEGDAREGGIELLADTTFSADLTKLQAGIDTAMAKSDSIPTGTYSQIRLVTADTADVLYETASGETARADLKQPSAAESGIKVNFDPVTLDSTDQAEITLDFSVEDSFVKAGQSGKFIFKPVVRAESVVVNNDSTNT